MTATSFVRAAAAAGIALLVAGCNGSADGAGSSSTSSTPAPATSSTTSAAPSSTTTTTVPSSTSQSMAEKYPETPEGAVAFVRAYFAAYNTAIQDPSRSADFEKMAGPGCASCQTLKGQIQRYKQKGARAEGPSVILTAVQHEPNPNRMVVLAGVDQRKQRLVTDSVEVVSTIPAGKQNLALTLSRQATGWQVADVERYLGDL